MGIYIIFSRIKVAYERNVDKILVGRSSEMDDTTLNPPPIDTSTPMCAIGAETFISTNEPVGGLSNQSENGTVTQTMNSELNNTLKIPELPTNFEQNVLRLGCVSSDVELGLDPPGNEHEQTDQNLQNSSNETVTSPLSSKVIAPINDLCEPFVGDGEMCEETDNLSLEDIEIIDLTAQDDAPTSRRASLDRAAKRRASLDRAAKRRASLDRASKGQATLNKVVNERPTPNLNGPLKRSKTPIERPKTPLGRPKRNNRFTGYSAPGHSSKRSKPKNRANGKFHCELCDYTTDNITNLNAHHRIHKGKRPYKCEKCTKSFVQKVQRDVHQRLHFKFKCKICRLNFRTEFTRNSHQKSCNAKRYECDLCRYTTALKTSIDNHLRQHTGEKPFECIHCSKRFVQVTNLNDHLKAHHNYKICLDRTGFDKTAYV